MAEENEIVFLRNFYWKMDKNRELIRELKKQIESLEYTIQLQKEQIAIHLNSDRVNSDRSVTERVALFIKTVSVSNILLKTTVLNQSSLYKIQNGGKCDTVILGELVNIYPTLNANWVLKGIGEMFLSKSRTIPTTDPKKIKTPKVERGTKIMQPTDNSVTTDLSLEEIGFLQTLLKGEMKYDPVSRYKLRRVSIPLEEKGLIKRSRAKIKGGQIIYEIKNLDFVKKHFPFLFDDETPSANA